MSWKTAGPPPDCWLARIYSEGLTFPHGAPAFWSTRAITLARDGAEADVPACPEGVKLLGKVANAEIHIAVSHGGAGTRGPRFRTSRQNAMAQCAGAQPCAPERRSEEDKSEL